MSTFRLKRGDTLPILRVALFEPDPASPGSLQVHDLTGSTSWYLHIRRADGVWLKRSMAVEGSPTLGVLRYAWVTTDWAVYSANGTVGGLTSGLPAAPGRVEHSMEYEVLGPASARLTFPNGAETLEASYDTLSITMDLGDG
jgi:hypothetical protein